MSSDLTGSRQAATTAGALDVMLACVDLAARCFGAVRAGDCAPFAPVPARA